MPPQPQQQDNKRQAAREVIDILHEISTILNTHLDRTELSLCVSLIENGVNPEALAAVIKELRREAAAATTTTTLGARAAME
ncbi:mitotic-spindle organizing protein 1 [Blastomyces percursus]|uniref:Mitotic-spindle organizing protein 1 n=1 Tax=Blastomyces percursus TaxID=1658174 RepID=A0A1J9R6B3_9EURO|nr:mitotic-spindle organizing protein 1 [Blastomyces percursus]